jgi:ABC-type antimicrobial peptide transport system permease subunit
MNVYLKAQRDPAAIFAPVRAVVRQIDPNVPMYDMRTLIDQVDKSLVTERLMALLSAAFGGLATILAAMGLYGVMAYVVSRRTREIGIRMALGADRGSVVWLVMREVLLLAVTGVVIGLGSSWALTRLVESQLFEVQPSDPLTMVAATFGIAAVAMLAGYLPARRATGIDPTTALRFE